MTNRDGMATSAAPSLEREIMAIERHRVDGVNEVGLHYLAYSYPAEDELRIERAYPSEGTLQLEQGKATLGHEPGAWVPLVRDGTPVTPPDQIVEEMRLAWERHPNRLESRPYASATDEALAKSLDAEAPLLGPADVAAALTDPEAHIGPLSCTPDDLAKAEELLQRVMTEANRQQIDGGETGLLGRELMRIEQTSAHGVTETYLHYGGISYVVDDELRIEHGIWIEVPLLRDGMTVTPPDQIVRRAYDAWTDGTNYLDTLRYTEEGEAGLLAMIDDEWGPALSPRDVADALADPEAHVGPLSCTFDDLRRAECLLQREEPCR